MEELNTLMLESTSVHPIAFDAVWALAAALNATEEMRGSDEMVNQTNCKELVGELVPLNEFNYSNEFMGCVLKYNLQQTDFLGVSVSEVV